VEARVLWRAKIVLSAAQGKENRQIAQELGSNRVTVGLWRRRSAEGRLEAIRKDAPAADARPPARRQRLTRRIVERTTQSQSKDGSSDIHVAPSNHRERCKTCQRVITRRSPQSLCTRHHCQGSTVTLEPDKDNHDVWLMRHPFVMVRAEKHTAQVPGELRLKIEQHFTSRKGRTNCLVATSTLEMGVNGAVLSGRAPGAIEATILNLRPTGTEGNCDNE